MKAKLSNARISPKKMNLIAGLVRRVNVSDALNILKFTNKKGSKMLWKLLNSAVANAENNFSQDKESLVIDEVKVTKGSTYKRFRPVSRGRAHPYKHVNTHVTIMLKAEATEPVKTPVAKEVKEAKTTAKKAAPKRAAKPKVEKE